MCEDGGLQKALVCRVESSGDPTEIETNKTKNNKTTIMKTTMHIQLQLRDWYSWYIK